MVGLADTPPTPIEYTAAWELQRELHAEVVAGRTPGTVLLLEHPSVYTAGRRTQPHERPADGIPVIDVDRGGKITWHGPGQLVGYPIVTLPESVKVVDYVRRVEEALIRTLADLGLRTGRVRGRSGVWLPADGERIERKVAAIGIRVAQGTTMHGFALNVDPDLSYFDTFVPCGITDAGVTSLAAELGREATPTLLQTVEVLRPHLEELLSFGDYVPSPDLADQHQTTDQARISYGLSTAAVG
ncbi:lipoyl(octanoyl) transferase LipB [Auraticoccus sp. F435]|uniref:Octanoyltransferase n=1 Tax=Auraticoccus cholistanensis TaxID=2656650 RepID=A0A6A9UWR7_9ACTN|nr:lipoyl(octanoyl) transferase LipB [Auraticoccus cholistanensis]MVA77386.1 lipoyl(octanoyl) transferase LipB [Auraticoccus cholistanensis]